MKKVLIVANYLQKHLAVFHTPTINMLKYDLNYVVDIACKEDTGNKELVNSLGVNDFFDINFSRNPLSLDNWRAYRELQDVVLSGDYDIIHCHTAIPSAIVRLIAKNNSSKIKSKIIYTAHGFHFLKKGPWINWVIYYPIEKWLSKYTDALITINQEDYELAKNKFFAKNILYLPGIGVNLDKFSPVTNLEEKQMLREKLKLPKDDFIITVVGELNKNKNQKLSIEIYSEIEKHIKNSKLLLVGEGPEKQNLMRIVKEKQMINQVLFLGYRTDVNSILKSSDILLSTSLREGLPVNILEAVATEIPVVATNIRGNKELVFSSQNGLLYNIDDSYCAARSIIEIYEKYDKYEASIMSTSKLLREKYSEENVLNIIKKIYMDMEVYK